MSKSRLFVGAAVIVLAVVFFGWAGDDDDAGDEPLVVVITRGDIENAVTAAGSLQPKFWVDVGAQVSGQLQVLHVDVGDTVAEGELLAEIDASVQTNRVVASRASLSAEQALVSAREAALDLAHSNLERQKELAGQNLASHSDLDNAINQLASAESALVELRSRIDRSRASLKSDEAQLGYSRIYAPMSGTVIALTKTVGQTMNASQQVPTILRIADLTNMTAQAEVSEADVGKLQVGTPVYFTTLGGGKRRWHGEVRQILPSPTTTNNVVFYPVLFDVPNADGALLPEMTAQVFFVTSSIRDVLKVPVAALQYAGGDPTVAAVELIRDDGQREQRSVQLGLTDRVAAQVRSGLREGDQVVAGVAEDSEQPQGGIRIRPGPRR
jgi:macrolide-specific efflux system membrane fusion protein